MVATFTDAVSGSTIYVNPVYVVTLRPDPEHPEENSVLKLRDGEAIRVKGDHEEIARKLVDAQA
jgi:hypothetical protein